MAQHDYNLADDNGAAFRADANLLFQAIASMNSGATQPATRFANMGWFDTANNLMKVRNESNAAWITIAEKTATDCNPYHGTVALEAAVMAWTAKILTRTAASIPTMPAAVAGAVGPAAVPSTVRPSPVPSSSTARSSTTRPAVATVAMVEMEETAHSPTTVATTHPTTVK